MELAAWVSLNMYVTDSIALLPSAVHSLPSRGAGSVTAENSVCLPPAASRCSGTPVEKKACVGLFSPQNESASLFCTCLSVSVLIFPKV